MRRKLIWLLSAIAVIAFSVWGLSYHTFEFRGGTSITDSGLFSYPRYRASLGDVPMWKNGEYLFSVHGLPSGRLDFVLQVVDATDADRVQLASLSTAVGVLIVDSSEKKICESDGSLNDASHRGRESWVLASSMSGTTF
jgi:hypothetical protein